MRRPAAICATTATLLTALAVYGVVDFFRWLTLASTRIDWTEEPDLLAWWEQLDNGL